MKIKLLFLTMLFSVLGWGQVSLTLDNYGTTAQNPLVRTGCTTVNPASSPWELRTTGASTIYSWVNPSVSFSGGSNAFTNLGNGVATKTLTYDNAISTIGYTGIAVRFGGLKSGTVPNVDVSFSTDGVVYTSAGTVTLTTSWVAYTTNLPVAAEGITNLRIRFSILANNSAVNFLRIDDFHVIGFTSCSTPVITTNPSIAGQTLCQGAAATALSVVASGAPTLTYQWYSNASASNSGGTLISGATSASYTPLTSSAGTAYYYCVVGSTCTPTPVSATSNVSGAIVVNTVPANPSGSIAISANPSCGPATLSYPAGSYWQTTAGGTSTALPTSSNYILNTSGTIYVRNYNGTCWSAGDINSGAITINNPVVITTQPANSAIFSGGSTSFSVAAIGTGLSYQWQVDTGSGFANLINVAPYSNVTTATMNISAATVGMNGYLYRCVVSGAAPCTSVNSNSALLTVTLYVPAGTVLKPGDLVFVGYDSIVGDGACTATNNARDKFYVATLVDILPGTQFLVVNSRYEAGAAANIRTDKWYSGGSAPFDDPGYLTFTWTGVTSIPKGSIISFKVLNTIVQEVSVNNVLEPLLTWATSLNQCNISSSDADQIYLMQGVFTSFGIVGTTRYNTFTGRVLYGLTNGVAWIPFSSAVSALGTGGTTRQSRLPDDIECFNIESGPLTGARYYNNSALHTGTKYQLLSALINVGNWTIPSNDNCLNTVDDFTGIIGAAVGKPFIVTLGNPDGTWTGATDTDWFKCVNWEGLSVPKSTDDVIIPSTPANQPIIGASPLKYPTGAFSNNLTLDNGSTLGMPNALSQLNLFGNWTNNAGNVGFSEGLGTVYFEGSMTQIINAVTPEGTETFYNLIFNNNFTTSVSNNIIATGNLTVNATKTLTVSPNNFVQVTNNVTNNGTFNIQNNGSLVQINDLGVNTGNITLDRVSNVRLQDYVYWSSPVVGKTVAGMFPTTPYTYSWETTTANANGGQGTWIPYSGNMVAGNGYIARAPSGTSASVVTPLNTSFTGVPQNGIFTPTIARGTNFTGAGTQGIMRTDTDDNWNLLGNPYPSAIDVVSTGGFLDANPQLDTFIKIWTHTQLPTNTVDPFYQDFVNNYFPGDYSTYNRTGASSGPGDYKVGSGQGFMVLMVPGTATTSTVTFNNSMRSRTFANNQFSKSANAQTDAPAERHRIWLDLVSPTETTRTLVGYVADATQGLDKAFDAFTDYKPAQNFYSVINDNPYTIQGRTLPFDVNDRVSMGIKTPTNGTYTIAIATVDGLFSARSQKIYIEDKLLNTINDITAMPYHFTATQGVTNDRFVLRYTDQTLNNAGFDLVENGVSIFGSNNEIKINSSIENIKDYTVYNVLGQILASKNNVNSNQSAVSSILKNNQTLVVKVTLENGQTVIKKVLF